MKIFGTIFFEKKEVALGKGSVTQFIVFENKKLCSMIFYRWNTIDQVRFHTHAFSSYAFLLRGRYVEHVKPYCNTNLTVIKTVDQWLKPRFIPKNYCHSIKYAVPKTLTVVFTGPWQKNWYEYFPDTKKWVKYGWGRVKLGTFDSLPKEK